MGTLTGNTPGSTYLGLLKTTDSQALSTSLKVIEDGAGNGSPLKLSTSAVGVGSIADVETALNAKITAASNLGAGEGIFGSASGTTLQFKSLVAGDNVTLSSDANTITINSTGGGGGSVAWGDITGTLSTQTDLQSALDAKQATLVSGTNIKTINSTSLLGSGNISITDTNTTYDLGSSQNVSDVDITLTGSDATTDTVKLVAGSNITLTDNGSNQVTVASSDAFNGTVTSVGIATTTSGVSVSGGPITSSGTLNIEVGTAGAGADGLLSSSDWNTFSSKQDAITGAASTVTTSNLVGDLALVSDGAGKIASSSVTSTELGYLGGVTSAVQTQVDAKTSKLISLNTQTGTTYTLVLGDADKLVEMDNAAANTLTVPPNSSVAFSTGTQIIVVQKGAGTTTIAAGSGVTLLSKDSALGIGGQYGAATCIKIATDTWYVIGDLA